MRKWQSLSLKTDFQSRSRLEVNSTPHTSRLVELLSGVTELVKSLLLLWESSLNVFVRVEVSFISTLHTDCKILLHLQPGVSAFQEVCKFRHSFDKNQDFIIACVPLKCKQTCILSFVTWLSRYRTVKHALAITWCSFCCPDPIIYWNMHFNT